MRYGMKIQLVNRNQEWHNLLIEVYDYSPNYTNTVNMLFRRPELMWDVKKLIDKGIDAILKKEGLLKGWRFDEVEIMQLDEDEIFDYQLYFDLERDEVGVSKIKYDLEKINVE